jgi:hypothetical protein
VATLLPEGIVPVLLVGARDKARACAAATGLAWARGWPPRRVLRGGAALRGGEEEHGMRSDADEAMKAKAGRFAKPKAIGCAVVGGVVLAVILAWLLGFFTWLLS